jgi:hypothetical protein
MGGSSGDKADCHSDLASSDRANLLQVEKLEVSDPPPRPQPSA